MLQKNYYSKPVSVSGCLASPQEGYLPVFECKVQVSTQHFIYLIHCL